MKSDHLYGTGDGISQLRWDWWPVNSLTAWLSSSSRNIAGPPHKQPAAILSVVTCFFSEQMCKDARGSLPRRPGDVSGRVQCGRGHHPAAGGHEVPATIRKVTLWSLLTLEPAEAQHANISNNCHKIVVKEALHSCSRRCSVCPFPRQNSVSPEPTTVRSDSD